MPFCDATTALNTRSGSTGPREAARWDAFLRAALARLLELVEGLHQRQ